MRAVAAVAPAVVPLIALSGCSVTVGGGSSSRPRETVTVTAVPQTPASSASASPSASPSASTTPSTLGSSAAAPSTYAEGAEVVGRSTPMGDFDVFVSPTRNIYCTSAVSTLLVGCELGSGRITDAAACAGAQVGGVGRLEISRSGATNAVCNSDTVRTVPAQNLEPVPYGSSVRSAQGRVECAVEQNGVTCLDTESHVGFFLNRAEYRILR